MIIQESYNRFKENHDLLLESLKTDLPNEYNSKSELWVSLFKDRKKSKIGQFEDLVTFLSDSNSITNGISSSAYNNDIEAFVEYYSAVLSEDLIKEYPLSNIGSPSFINFRGQITNTSYLAKLVYFQEFNAILDKCKVDFNNIDVLEIGAGFGGMANFILKSGVASSYTIIDLPENLSMSLFYLSELYPEKSINILKHDEKIENIKDQSLNFVTPGNIDALQNCNFDLVINTDSLGEMPSHTSKAYINWIYDHLNLDGRFFSKNGHARSKDSVKLPSEYGYQKFQIEHLSGFSVPSRLWDDQSHVLLLKKEMEKPKSFQNQNFDTICNLLSLGLNFESSELCRNFSNNSLDDFEVQFLTEVEAIFSDISNLRKMSSFSNGSLNLMSNFLKGLSYYLLGNRKLAVENLELYKKGASSCISESICLFILSTLKGKSVFSNNYNCLTTSYFINEILDYENYNPIVKRLIYQARKDIIRKKMSKPGSYSPSSVVKMKNIYLNFKEGKGIKVARY